ncbi:hypothetical protein N7457_004823 [Penicillium paradoxum]|uniref:uncharacterized protein n=1 Tax=Penicillium paradoxum TaxID=176176 RepID=UPI0025486563|nr:uncharacterized protein N7457_004823 [Penicillium paradoxum]KAJ5783049.1 hypothetical protein N7457_004823 [Penicillium paradoxum]
MSLRNSDIKAPQQSRLLAEPQPQGLTTSTTEADVESAEYSGPVIEAQPRETASSSKETKIENQSSRLPIDSQAQSATPSENIESDATQPSLVAMQPQPQVESDNPEFASSQHDPGPIDTEAPTHSDEENIHADTAVFSVSGNLLTLRHSPSFDSDHSPFASSHDSLNLLDEDAPPIPGDSHGSNNDEAAFASNDNNSEGSTDSGTTVYVDAVASLSLGVSDNVLASSNDQAGFASSYESFNFIDHNAPDLPGSSNDEAGFASNDNNSEGSTASDETTIYIGFDASLSPDLSGGFVAPSNDQGESASSDNGSGREDTDALTSDDTIPDDQHDSSTGYGDGEGEGSDDDPANIVWQSYDETNRWWYTSDSRRYKWDDSTASDHSLAAPLVPPPVPQIIITPPDHQVRVSLPPIDYGRLRPRGNLPLVEILPASRRVRGGAPPGFAPESSRAGEARARGLNQGSSSSEPTPRLFGLTSEEEVSEIAHIEDVGGYDSDS